MLFDLFASLGDKPTTIDLIEDRFPGIIGVWRICEHDVEAVRILLDPVEDVGLNNGCPVVISKGLEVVTDAIDRTSVLLDEDAMSSTATERFDSERTATCVQIEDL